MNNPEYIIDGIFRTVKEYPFDFKCYTKKRWAGKKLKDIFQKEFKGYKDNYFVLHLIR